MLTGDNTETARAIAAQIGIDEAMAELLPSDKLAAVERLVARYGHVGMVGDGINDAPALARISWALRWASQEAMRPLKLPTLR